MKLSDKFEKQLTTSLTGAILISLLFWAVALGQPATVGMVNTNANLRAGPGTSYATTGRATQGQLVAIVGKDKAGDWYQLSGGPWIAAFLVDVEPSTPKTTITTGTATSEITTAAISAPLTVPATLTTSALTAIRDANLRAGPGTTYTISGTVSAGQTLAIRSKNTDGSWLQLANGAWIAAFLVNQFPAAARATTTAGPVPAISTPPPPTPAPATSGNDFVVVQKHLWDPYENGGSLDGPSVHCGLARELIVNVLDVNGNRLNGVAVQVQYGAKEIYVTGSQGKGDGVAEFVLGSGQDVKVLRDNDGRDVTSDLVTGLVTNPAYIPYETLIASNYCQDADSCKNFADTYSCEGHFSWTVTFKRQR